MERATNPEGQELMNDVNEYIQNLQAEDEERFRGKWLLVVHWDHVHPSPHGEEDHEGIPEDELEKVYTEMAKFYELDYCRAMSVCMCTPFRMKYD